MSTATTPHIHDPQGSVWRRWDPHLHLPGTLFEDRYDDITIEEALDRLATISPAIEAIGITDYVTTRSYRSAFDAWTAGHGAGIRLLFPNVEMRLATATQKGAGVNLHFLAAPDQVDELERFLGRLKFTYQQEPYSPTEPDLVRLGRAHLHDPETDHETALRTGANQFKVNRDQLDELRDTSTWAKEHLLVAVAAGQNDGTSGVRGSGGAFEATRQEIERRAHIVFSGRPQDRLFWLGLGADSRAELHRKYNGRKLTLHGSDAHSADRLGRPDQDRFTWIKGDPSFETLKQACIEPELRAWIGAESPAESEDASRIVGVRLDGHDGWLAGDEVQVNPGLVAIIGARGSGKTALADLIAVGAGDVAPFENKQSFIKRANRNRLLNDCTVTVEWTDDRESSASLAVEQERDAHVLPTVRYLSQQFVEKLCSSDGVTEELLAEIKRVVFSTWPVEERLGATSFDELLDVRIAAAQSRQREQVEALDALSGEITQQRILQRSLADLRKELAEREAALERVRTEQKALSESRDETLTARLEVIRHALEQRQDEVQKLARRERAILALREDVEQLRESGFGRQLDSLRSRHQELELPEDEWQRFLTDFVGDVDSVLSRRLEETTSRKVERQGPNDPEAIPQIEIETPDQLQALSLAALQAETTRLEKAMGLDERKGRKLRALAGKASETLTAIDSLRGQVTLAEDADSAIERLTAERSSRYARYFDALLSEEQELQELYLPLEKLLDSSGSSARKLRFAVSRSVDIDGWATWGESLLDLRRGGDFRHRGSLHDLASAGLLQAWQEGTGEEVAEAVRDFSRLHSESFREQGRAIAKGSLSKYRAWEAEINSWLYNADHVTLDYTLEYGGVGIERLSPGTKGIVLLLLYLAVDVEDSIPLIIDQPEENLDPESIYTELVDLFRSTSRRRQVIMVTHNANLVVNTEVDQVIVANSESRGDKSLPEVRYLTGGLESPEVRDAVCQVLEGGAEAFRERARRLRVSLVG